MTRTLSILFVSVAALWGSHASGAPPQDSLARPRIPEAVTVADTRATPEAWTPAMVELMGRLRSAGDLPPPRLHDSLMRWGEAGDELPDLEQIVYFERCVALAESAGDMPLKIEMMRELSSPYRHLDSIKRNFDLLHEALALAERYDPGAAGPLHRKLGWSCYENEDYDNAVDHYRTSLRAYRRDGNRDEVLWNQLMIAQVYFDMGEYRRVEGVMAGFFDGLDTLPPEYAGEAHERFVRTYTLWGTNWLALAAAKAGRDRVALRLWARSDSLAADLPDEFVTGDMVTRLYYGSPLYETADLREAIEELRRRDGLLSDEQRAVIRLLRARLLLREGEPARARAALADAGDRAFGSAEHRLEAYALREEAAVMRADLPEAYRLRVRYDSLRERRLLARETSLSAYHDGRLRMEHLQQKLQRLDRAEASSARERRLRVRVTMWGGFGLLVLSALLSVAFVLYRQRVVMSEGLAGAVAEKTADLTRRNAELKRFNYVLAHDLKEPLRSVVSFSQLAARRNRDDDVGEYLRFAVTSARQLDDLVSGMLHYQQPPETEHSVGLLGDVAAEAIATTRARFPRKDVTLTAVDLPLAFPFPAAVLREALEITFANAALFNDNEFVEVTLQYLREGDAHMLTVNDNGIGIADEYRERVFEIFNRLHTREAYPGAGIGLARLRRILRPVGGGARVLHSSPGFGTTVAMRWRASAGPTSAPRQTASSRARSTA